METGPAFDPIAAALAEDIGPGDVTAEAFVPASARASARLFAKEPCVLAGVETAAEVFRRVGPDLAICLLARDGDRLSGGDVALVVSGSVRALLTAERTALNFVQRLSGVATLTRRFVDAVEGTRARILDTRKTTPGLRRLERAAVVAGGGTNHRFGLYDMAMVKDNHLAAGSDLAALQAGIDRVKAIRPGARVEMEADTLEQVAAFLALRGVDVILLDNMLPDIMRRAVEMGRGKGVLFEASGGVTLASVRAIAETGVDFVSVGALTHSAPAIDFSLEIE